VKGTALSWSGEVKGTAHRYCTLRFVTQAQLLQARTDSHASDPDSVPAIKMATLTKNAVLLRSRCRTVKRLNSIGALYRGVEGENLVVASDAAIAQPLHGDGSRCQNCARMVLIVVGNQSSSVARRWHIAQSDGTGCGIGFGAFPKPLPKPCEYAPAS
jgi:hypothetical protein